MNALGVAKAMEERAERVARRMEAWRPLANLLAGLLLLGVAGGLTFLWADARVPPQHLPWKPLRLDHPVGLATAAKLARAEADPILCRGVLDAGRAAYRPLPDRQAQGYCRVKGALALGAVSRLEPRAPPMRCGLGLGYLIWLRQVVQPAARAELGVEVAEVEHYGTYACRRIYGGGAGARVSEHALANALDVAAFRLTDGRTVSVRRDWPGGGAEARFLRRVRDGACGLFDGVLGPDYNAAHADHLHLDRGPYRVCR
jgi:hypothetical protein